MLGRRISDPEQVEAAGVTEAAGMGLLDMDTVFAGQKIQTQTQGTFSGITGMLSELNGCCYAGYEIHMGRSRTSLPPLMGTGHVYGSYVHGIFDAPAALHTFDRASYREQQYDTLAQVVRSGLDMDYIYRVLRREV